MRKINIVLLLTFLSTLGLYASNEIKGKEKETIINNIIRTNVLSGYKGDVLIKVLWHEEDYSGISGMANNKDKVYKAYFDLVDKNSQKIIFYKDTNLKELEINLINGKLKIVYDGKDITKNLKDYEKYLSKYPYMLWNFSLYLDETPVYLCPSVDLTLYIDDIKDERNNITTSNEDGASYVIDMFESSGEGVIDTGIEIDKYYRILLFYIADNASRYEWGKNVPSKITEIGIVESIEIVFSDEKGWVKK